nr:K(+)-stimulated pyrophosphate-energized sodium pump (Na(+)-PPase) like [Ipomoea batatas]GME16561.1 K(+)-stimulated pyrophosphate-energized sodium pump (Na(+)-PPase) like [Ipomoea batatas]
MPPVSTPRNSAYLTALTQEIEKKLQRALTSPSQRRDLLQQLFADIALEVDDRAKEIIFGSEDVISAAEERIEGPICFYDVLADHFILVPHNGKAILDLIVQLWSQSFCSNIFTLLFHKWLFEVELDNSEVLLRYSSALVQGATNVFWIDIQTNTRRFQSLFRYLLEEVSLVPDRLKKIPLQAQRSLFLLLSRFLFFYDSGLELRMATSTRLKTCLYSFTSPGAPMYPTRAVRHAAWNALNLLFPVSIFFDSSRL